MSRHKDRHGASFVPGRGKLVRMVVVALGPVVVTFAVLVVLPVVAEIVLVVLVLVVWVVITRGVVVRLVAQYTGLRLDGQRAYLVSSSTFRSTR